MNQKFSGHVRLIALLLIMPVVSVFGQNSSPEQQVDLVFSEWNMPETPGVSVAIVRDGKFLVKKSYGVANMEYKISGTPSTVYELGSVSKQFTAFAILLLEQQGKLSLDDDIRKYIPEFPDLGKVITLQHLLHHTSGIRDEIDLLCMAGWRTDDVITHDQVISMACRQKELCFPPGNEYRYSNTNYSLLAEIVARVSGQSFASFASEHIFKPLGMTHTLVNDNYERIVDNMALSYSSDGKEYRKNVLSCSNFGSSNVLSNVEDLALWVSNFENPVICSKNLIQKMNECGILNNGDKIDYAMGQEVIRYQGVTIIDHNGALAGYRSMLARFPDQKFAIILLSNNASFNPQAAAIKIADIYLKDQFIAGTSAEETASSQGAEDKEYPADLRLLSLFTGKYELRPEFIINITAEGTKLFIEAHEVPLTRLVQVSPNEFTLPAMHAKLTFISDNSGEVNQINILLNDQPMSARRVISFNEEFVNPDFYNGCFYSAELGTAYNFVTRNGQLIARHARLGDIVMKPVKPDQFSTEKWFLKRIEFTRDGNNSINGCIATGGRVTGVKFTKIE